MDRESDAERRGTKRKLVLLWNQQDVFNYTVKYLAYNITSRKYLVKFFAAFPTFKQKPNQNRTKILHRLITNTSMVKHVKA